MTTFEFTARIVVEWDDEETYDNLSFKDQMTIDDDVKSTVVAALSMAEGTIDVNDIEMDLDITEVTG